MTNELDTKLNTEVNDLMKRAREARLEQYRREEEKLLDKEEIDSLRTRYPEELFRKYFLPYFSGQISISEDPTVIPRWVSIAGMPSNEVVIINDKDEEVAIVPPIMDTSRINPLRNNDKERLYYDIASDYILRKDINESLANNHLTMELDEKVNAMGEINAVQTREKEWIKLMTYFGVDLPSGVSGVDIKSDTDEDSDKERERVDDELIYD